MDTGTKISGAAHIGLIALMAFGGAFTADPLPFEVSEVSVISSDDFAALTTGQSGPETIEQPAALAAPTDEPEPPRAVPQEDPDPQQDQPEAATAPPPDPVPDIVPETPDADVTDTAPVLDTPSEAAGNVTPRAAPDPAPAPSERVAPEPVAAPPPDSAPDEVAQPEIAPDEGADTPQTPQEATAPEEASDQIVTEAEQSAALAPSRSVRPASRPARQPTAEITAPAPEAEEAPDTSAAVNAALAEALGTADPAPAAPTGPPLTGGEKEGLRVAVSRCWNVGSLSSDALATTVVVAVSLAQDGKPVTGSVRMLSSSGGSDAAARQAFEAARRAIIRCGASGFDLPPDKYSQWRDIEMTFNPERMRIK